MLRAVTVMAAAGISQFIDVGAGLPHGPAVHQAARILVPDARVVYAEVDPVACTLWQALLVGDQQAAVVLADARGTGGHPAHPEVRRLIAAHTVMLGHSHGSLVVGEAAVRAPGNWPTTWPSSAAPASV